MRLAVHQPDAVIRVLLLAQPDPEAPPDDERLYPEERKAELARRRAHLALLEAQIAAATRALEHGGG